MSEISPKVQLTDPKALRALAHPLRLALVALLRREGPLTATQAAQHLNDNVPNCSFHLRQLAKYGLVERTEGADNREKPWQATAWGTTWTDNSDDPDTKMAVNQLNSVITGRHFDRIQAWLSRRQDEPAEWRAVTGLGDSLLYLTPDEVAELDRRMDEVLAEFRPRQTDPSLRPPDARLVNIIQFVLTHDQESQ